MLFIKSTLLSISALLVSSTSVFTPPTAEVIDDEYCYSVTITLNLPGTDTGASVAVSACGDTPAQGLFNLGVAVRHAYLNQEEPQQ